MWELVVPSLWIVNINPKLLFQKSLGNILKFCDGICHRIGRTFIFNDETNESKIFKVLIPGYIVIKMVKVVQQEAFTHTILIMNTGWKLTLRLEKIGGV